MQTRTDTPCRASRHHTSSSASLPPSMTRVASAKALNTQVAQMRQLGANHTGLQSLQGEARGAWAMHHAEKPLTVRLQVGQAKSGTRGERDLPPTTEQPRPAGAWMPRAADRQPATKAARPRLGQRDKSGPNRPTGWRPIAMLSPPTPVPTGQRAPCPRCGHVWHHAGRRRRPRLGGQ